MSGVMYGWLIIVSDDYEVWWLWLRSVMTMTMKCDEKSDAHDVDEARMSDACC